MLHVDGLHARYGTSRVLHGASLDVQAGQAVALLGRNGAGKSTLLKSVMALGPDVQGSIEWQGRQLIGLPTHRIARSGLGYVPEDRRVYTEMSVLDNLLVGAAGSARHREPLPVEDIWEWFPTLRGMQRRQAGTLSGGEQQMLAIARSLIGNPSLLLLDEPTEGLAPLIVRSLAGSIRALIAETGLGLLIAEQRVGFALDLVDHVYLIDAGCIVFDDTSAVLRSRRDVQERYLAV